MSHHSSAATAFPFWQRNCGHINKIGSKARLCVVRKSFVSFSLPLFHSSPLLKNIKSSAWCKTLSRYGSSSRESNSFCGADFISKKLLKKLCSSRESTKVLVNFAGSRHLCQTCRLKMEAHTPLSWCHDKMVTMQWPWLLLHCTFGAALPNRVD